MVAILSLVLCTPPRTSGPASVERLAKKSGWLCVVAMTLCAEKQTSQQRMIMLRDSLVVLRPAPPRPGLYCESSEEMRVNKSTTGRIV